MNAPFQNAKADPNDARVDNEIGLLGALLHYADPALFRIAAAIVGPEHFFEGFNARLFEIIRRGIDAGKVGFPLVHYVMAEIRDDATFKELKLTPSALVASYCARAVPGIGVEATAAKPGTTPSRSI